jgi:predicted transcriptional regulator of viral defense system
MKLTKAISLKIIELNQPVITLYQFSVILHQLYLSKSYRGEKIQAIKKDAANLQTLSDALDSLMDDGILDPYRGSPKKSVFSILGRSETDPGEVACSVDPFCYISHLSAMEHHGLTNRMPSKLFISSPGKGLWTNYANERMRKEVGKSLDVYLANSLPKLTKIKMNKIGRTIVHRHNSIHLGAYKNVKGKCLRISTIGRTFLDMLRNPELCGGIIHVLDVYEEHAETYLKLIVDEVENNGSPIDKVRAGYILDERLGLQHPSIDGWVLLAQRGGSRKLDPSGEYIPEFSEKWCLSINVFM